MGGIRSGIARTFMSEDNFLNYFWYIHPYQFSALLFQGNEKDKKLYSKAIHFLKRYIWNIQNISRWINDLWLLFC